MKLAEAKTIYGDGHVGQKYVTPTAVVDEKVSYLIDVFWYFQEFVFQPFRNSPMVLAEAKSIYDDGHVGQKYLTPSVANDEKVVHLKTNKFYKNQYFSHSEQLQ